MKLYKVVFQDDLECTGHNLITELAIADNEENAINNAWNRYYNSCKGKYKPKRNQYYVYSISEVAHLDGYNIKIE